MDLYETLRRTAKKRYREDVTAAGERLRFAIKNINMLHKLMGEGPQRVRRNDGIRRSAPDTPFAKLTSLEAAEATLIERGPLTIAALTVEVQSRGHRPTHDPRKLAHCIKSAFGHHKGRFVRDANLRWIVI
jgi:hypothetical protein